MQKWYFNGIDLCTKAWYVESVLDGLGPPGFRGDDLQVPLKHGKISTKKRYNSKNITLAMWVVGVDKITGLKQSGKTLLEGLYSNIDYLTMLFSKRGTFTLSRVLPNGEIRTAKAEIVNAVGFSVKPEGYAKFTVEFELADPCFYSGTLSSGEVTIASSPYTWTRSNNGIVEVTKAIITLTGPLSNPKLENLSNNIWVQYNGDILTGDTVIIDTDKYTCTMGAINVIGMISHAGDSNWLPLITESNSMRLTSDVTGGKCKIDFYPAYF